MSSNLDALKRAIEAAGGQSALGRMCGKRQGQVWYWLNHAHELPAEFVRPVSAGTGIPPHELRPDIFPPPAAAVPVEAAQ